MSNKYVNRSKISEAKFRELVKLFSLDLTATQIAELSGLNRNTVNRYLNGIRQRLAEYCNITAPFSELSVQDQQCWESEEIGIYEKDGRVFTIPFEGKKLDKNRNIASNVSELPSVEFVLDLKKNEHNWIEDRSSLQKSSPSKVHRIEGFWGYLKSRLEKFKGIHKQTYLLHIKETEFRFNNGKDELYYLILKIIRNHPLF